MAFSGSQNIDPSLRQTTLSSPPKVRDGLQPTENNHATPARAGQGHAHSLSHGHGQVKLQFQPAQSTQAQPPPPPHYSPLQPSPNPSSYQGIPTPSYYSTQHTHESPEEDQSPSANPSDPKDLKRPRACEACRQLKVKCELDDNNPAAPCKRCLKAGRQCVITAPNRKRQKKADSRVAELEKKIDALTASLAARGGGDADVLFEHSPHQHQPTEQPAHPGHPSPAPSLRPHLYADQWNAAPRHHLPPPSQSPQNNPHGIKRKMGGDYDYSTFGGELPRPFAPNYQAKTTAPSYNSMYSSELPKRDEAEYPPMDPITHGLTDIPTAKKCFDRYMTELCDHLPIVVFPANTKWEEVRRHKPVLFLAVLAVASGTIRPEIQTRLISEVTRILADRIVYRGEKSMELVQTIQCITTFYQPPERYEELNFNQLIHIAAVMALDLGMGKRFKKGSLALWRSHTENKRPLPDPNSAETRRCWLGCYYMCSK
jgi:Fungal Zn(2)-Cys(6) binuclear cluster domain